MLSFITKCALSDKYVEKSNYRVKLLGILKKYIASRLQFCTTKHTARLKKVVLTPPVVITSTKTMADEDENNNEKVKKCGPHSVAPKITEDLRKQKRYKKR